MILLSYVVVFQLFSWSSQCIPVWDLYNKEFGKAHSPPSTVIEVEVTLRPTVSRPVSLGVRRQSGTRDQFYFRLEIFFRQLRVCNFVAPSLTRGRVCNLLYNCFWALPEQSLLGLSPAELTALCYCLIWYSPNLKGQVPAFISPNNRVAQLYPRTLGIYGSETEHNVFNKTKAYSSDRRK
jgi:hypothetical protein